MNELNKLLKQFKELKKMMKQFTNMKKGRKGKRKFNMPFF